MAGLLAIVRKEADRVDRWSDCPDMALLRLVGLRECPIFAKTGRADRRPDPVQIVV